MHPAWSIIFFTSVSGLGLGFSGWVMLGFLDLGSALEIFYAALISFGLIGAGLFSSTLHLGHPERAWRALSQWRSSWLSREGVLAVLVLIFLAGWFLFTFLYRTPPPMVGVFICVLALVTVYATSMIYASLKTVACWNNQITPACYLAFSICGGALLTMLLTELFNQTSNNSLQYTTIVTSVASWVIKFVWWWNLDNSEGHSTTESATGLGSFGRVRSLMPPHTSENYLQKEMGFVIARKHAIKLRVISLALGAVLPLCVLITNPFSVPLLALATGSHLLGIFVERWLFFAEAKHVVSLYYGDDKVTPALTT